MNRAVLLLSILAAPAAADDALGRLFFTPEQRRLIDERRLADGGPALVEGNAVRLDGVVKRSAGPDAVWSNGRPSAGATRRGRQPRARVWAENGSEVDLSVGETVDTATGFRRDIVPPGSIVVHVAGPAGGRNP